MHLPCCHLWLRVLHDPLCLIGTRSERSERHLLMGQIMPQFGARTDARTSGAFPAFPAWPTLGFKPDRLEQNARNTPNGIRTHAAAIEGTRRPLRVNERNT